MLSKMSSQAGACTDYNVRLPTETQIIIAADCSVSKLLKEMRSIFKSNPLEKKIQVIWDLLTRDHRDQNQTIWDSQSKMKTK